MYPFIASIIEVIGGQPFDLWKIRRQLRDSTISSNNLWKAAHISSLHRVCFYMPSIYLSNHLFDSPLGTALMVTPHVAYFEQIKTLKQTNNFVTYRIFPSNIYSTFCRELVFITGLTSTVPYLVSQGMSVELSSIIAGISSQIISQPFDTVKTIQERHGTFSWPRHVSSLWHGCLPRCLRGIWTFYCMNYFTK